MIYETDARKRERTLLMTRNEGGPASPVIPSVFISWAAHQELLELNSTSELEAVLNLTGSVVAEIPLDEARIAWVVVGVFAGFAVVTALMFGVWYVLPEYEWEQPVDDWRNISIGGHRHPSMLMAMDYTRDASRTENPRYSGRMDASDRSLSSSSSTS